MSKSRIAVVLVLTASLLVVPLPAGAEDPQADASANPAGLRARARYEKPGARADEEPSRPRVAAPRVVACDALGLTCLDPFDQCTNPLPSEFARGPVSAICETPDEAAAGTPSVYDLLLTANSEVAFPPPDITIAPDHYRAPDNTLTFVTGLPVWFWHNPTTWTPLTTRAQAGPTWAEITATPTTLAIYPGEPDTALTCPGPGTPLTDPADGADGSPDCGHTYTTPTATGEDRTPPATRRGPLPPPPPDHHVLTTAITWTITWQASDGRRGTLPPQTTQTDQAITVTSYRAQLVAP